MTKRGQAVIEALISSILVLACSLISLKIILKNIYELSVSEIYEQYILCQTQVEETINSSVCQENLKKKLNILNIKKYSLKNEKDTIELQIESDFLQKTFSTFRLKI